MECAADADPDVRSEALRTLAVLVGDKRRNTCSDPAIEARAREVMIAAIDDSDAAGREAALAGLVQTAAASRGGIPAQVQTGGQRLSGGDAAGALARRVQTEDGGWKALAWAALAEESCWSDSRGIETVPGFNATLWHAVWDKDAKIREPARKVWAQVYGQQELPSRRAGGSSGCSPSWPAFPASCWRFLHSGALINRTARASPQESRANGHWRPREESPAARGDTGSREPRDNRRGDLGIAGRIGSLLGVLGLLILLAMLLAGLVFITWGLQMRSGRTLDVAVVAVLACGSTLFFGFSFASRLLTCATVGFRFAEQGIVGYLIIDGTVAVGGICVLVNILRASSAHRAE